MQDLWRCKQRKGFQKRKPRRRSQEALTGNLLCFDLRGNRGKISQIVIFTPVGDGFQVLGVSLMCNVCISPSVRSRENLLSFQVKHIPANSSAGIRSANLVICAQNGFFRQLILIHVHKEIGLNKNLIIHTINVRVGVMVRNQILDSCGTSVSNPSLSGISPAISGPSFSCNLPLQFPYFSSQK